MTEHTTSRVRWFLVFWMFILSVVAFLDRVNIAVAGSAIADAYRLSNVQLGNIFSALLVGYALFQTPGGRLADRLGPRRLLAAGVVWWGIFTGLTALVPPNIAHPLLVFIAIRFLLGVAKAVVPVFQSVRFTMDSNPRARPCKRLDLRGRWRGRRFVASLGHIHHVALWVALVVLGLLHNRTYCRNRLVSGGSRQPERTPLSLSDRTQTHSSRNKSELFPARSRTSTSRALANSPEE